MTVIPEGYAQINWRFAGTQLPYGAEVTLGVDLGTFSETATDLAEAAHGMVATHIMPSMPTVLSLASTLVKFGPNSTGQSGEWSGNIAGSVGAEGLSPNVSYLVRKATAAGGRAGRGRMYWPGVAEEEVNQAGTVRAEMVTLLQGKFDDLWDALDVATFTPVVLHGVGSPLSTPTPIESFSVDGRVATQRRRLRR